ncbi:hypothetical protein ACJX0J_039615, partial [Zea mays]
WSNPHFQRFIELYGIGIIRFLVYQPIHVFGYLVYLGFFLNFPSICCCNFFEKILFASPLGSDASILIWSSNHYELGVFLSYFFV